MKSVPGNTSTTRIARRRVLQAAGLLSLSPALQAQDAGKPQLLGIQCFEIRVSDLQRSLAFYQDLFGAPLVSTHGGRSTLRMGTDQYMMLRALEPGETPAITQVGLRVAGYDLATQIRQLQALGLTQIDAPSVTEPGLTNAMRFWVRDRAGTPELHLADARGLIVQLVDPAYCGGSGALGADCQAPQPVAAGLFELDEINHFTAFVNDGAGASSWWQENFGFAVQAYQGPGSPVNGIGEGAQFMMFAGPFPGGENAPANLHHASFNLTGGFTEQGVLDALTGYGIKARGEGPVGPLMHYVSRRMPERGGAEGGTPEIYFTDPDGLLMQLQDPTYCGGGGYLGSECLDA